MAKRGRPRHPDILTPREWEVLALLREGLSNEDIAQRLGTMERTARYHVSEILSKLGVSTRQEAAAWQPEERRAWWAALSWLPVKKGWLVAWIAAALAGGVAVVIIAAVVFAFWALRATNGGDEHTTSLAANELTPAATFSSVERLMIALDDSADPVATGTNGLVRLVDTTSGQIVGEVKAGYEPEALIRPTASELLVTNAFGSSPRTDAPTLSVYALGDLASPLATIALPGRAAFIVWSGSMVLSGNERYLYYPAIDDAKTKRNCASSGGDASVCQVWTVGVVDLERLQVAADAPLGSNCMPRIQRQGEADALVICQDVKFGLSSANFVRDGVRLFLVTPKGNITKVASFPARRTADQLPSPIYTGATAGGQRYMLYDDGALFMEGNDSPVADLLPDDKMRFGFNTGASLGTDKYLLAYGDRASAQYNGLLIFDTSDPAGARSFTLPALVDHVAPVDATHVALLTYGQADMQIFDVQTASVTRQVNVPTGTKWLIGR